MRHPNATFRPLARVYAAGVGDTTVVDDERGEADVPTWVWVLLIILLVLVLFGGVGYGRRG
jgi:hypothetical protein